MAKQLSLNYKFTALGAPYVYTDWVDVSGYSRIQLQCHLQSAGAAGGIEVYGTGVTLDGRPDDASQFLLALPAGLSNSWLSSSIFFLAKFIRVKLNCSIGGPSDARVAITVQGKEDAR